MDDSCGGTGHWIFFVAGTFYPNFIAMEKLEDEIHKQELKVVESLGLKEPEFEFPSHDQLNCNYDADRNSLASFGCPI